MGSRPASCPLGSQRFLIKQPQGQNELTRARSKYTYIAISIIVPFVYLRQFGNHISLRKPAPSPTKGNILQPGKPGKCISSYYVYSRYYSCYRKNTQNMCVAHRTNPQDGDLPPSRVYSKALVYPRVVRNPSSSDFMRFWKESQDRTECILV